MLFDKIRKYFHRSVKPAFVYDQAVIVDVKFEGVDDFGSYEDQAAIRVLEQKMEEKLPQNAGIDGDEFGDAMCTIYIYGPSADRIFSSIEPVLKKSPFRGIDITLQYGLPQSPGTKEKKFSL